MPVEGGIGDYRGLPLTNPATAPFGHHRQKRGLPPRHRQLQLPSAPIAKCNTHPPRWLPYTTCFGNSTSVSRFVPDSTPPAPQFNTNPHPLTDPSRRPSQRPPLPDPDPNPIPPPPNPATPQILKIPAFHHGVRRIHRAVEDLRHGRNPNEPLYPGEATGRWSAVDAGEEGGLIWR